MRADPRFYFEIVTCPSIPRRMLRRNLMEDVRA